MLEMEEVLRRDPRTQHLLKHMRHSQLADAAVKFFARGEPGANRRLYRSRTFLRIMKVWVELARVPGSGWRSSLNRENRSLHTSDESLQIGQVIEIHGERTHRFVTSIGGSAGRFYAQFDGQRALPVGRIRWRLVAAQLPVAHRRVDTPTIWQRAQKHPIVSLLFLLGAIVAALGSITEGLGKLFQFLKKCLGS
jgi:hypothetical protein